MASKENPMLRMELELKKQRLPFEERLMEPNETTYAAIDAAQKEEDVYGPFDSVANLMEALNSSRMHSS